MSYQERTEENKVMNTRAVVVERLEHKLYGYEVKRCFCELSGKLQ